MKTRKSYVLRTVTRLTGLSLLVGFVLLTGCRKKNGGYDGPEKPTFLSIADANWDSGSSTNISANTTPRSKAQSNDLKTTFEYGDRLGLFLRGDSYEPIDNRIVTCTPDDESANGNKWVIDGNAIGLVNDEATLTAYFPYSEYGALTMDSIPLSAGAYNVNTNDVVWQRDVVNSLDPKAMFLNMQHAMTRVKLRFSKTTGNNTYLGTGKITAVQISDASTVSEANRVIYVNGYLNLTSDTPSVTRGVRGPVTIEESQILADTPLYDFLLLPVATINSGSITLRIRIDSQDLTTTFPTDLVSTWEAGNSYTYEITVVNGGAQVVFGKVGTTPWNYNGPITGDLAPSNPEYGGGNVEDWNSNPWGVDITDGK